MPLWGRTGTPTPLSRGSLERGPCSHSAAATAPQAKVGARESRGRAGHRVCAAGLGRRGARGWGGQIGISQVEPSMPRRGLCCWHRGIAGGESNPGAASCSSWASLLAPLPWESLGALGQRGWESPAAGAPGRAAPHAGGGLDPELGSLKRAQRSPHSGEQGGPCRSQGRRGPGSRPPIGPEPGPRVEVPAWGQPRPLVSRPRDQPGRLVLSLRLELQPPREEPALRSCARPRLAAVGACRRLLKPKGRSVRRALGQATRVSIRALLLNSCALPRVDLSFPGPCGSSAEKDNDCDLQGGPGDTQAGIYCRTWRRSRAQHIVGATNIPITNNDIDTPRVQD